MRRMSYKYYPQTIRRIIIMADGKMDISILLTISGKSITTNEYKIKDAPKSVVIELEKMLLDLMGNFMKAHEE